MAKPKIEPINFKQQPEPLPEQNPSSTWWDDHNISALTGSLIDISERGVSLPDNIRESYKTIISLRDNQNKLFKENINTLIQFISLN